MTVCADQVILETGTRIHSPAALRDVRQAADRTFLSELSPVGLDRLLAKAELRQVAKGDVVFDAGDLATAMILLIDGHISFTSTASSDRELTFDLLDPGATVAPWAVLGNLRYSVTARAVDAVCVLCLPMTALKSELACNARLGAALARSTADLAAEFADDLLQLKLRTTVDRLGSYILALADGSDGQAVLPYEKKLVAANLGMSPESLSRAFAQLRSLGVSLVGRRVQFVDPEALRQRFGIRPPNRPRRHA